MSSPLYPAQPGFEAVIFDMDGLVLDTEPTYIKAWQDAALNFGVRLSNSVCESLLGAQAADVRLALSEAMGAAFEPSLFFPVAERLWRECVTREGITVMPGLGRLLSLLKSRRTPYAMATNSERRYAVECLGIAGIAEQFELLVCRDDVRSGKPEPDLILEASRRLKTSPARCLVLEDSATGLLAAARAGAIPALVRMGDISGLISRLASARFQSLDGVADAIETGVES